MRKAVSQCEGQGAGALLLRDCTAPRGSLHNAETRGLVTKSQCQRIAAHKTVACLRFLKRRHCQGSQTGCSALLGHELPVLCNHRRSLSRLCSMEGATDGGRRGSQGVWNV